MGFHPRPHPLLPVEVIHRPEIRRRADPAILRVRHRHDFHQLIICGGGHGFHHVDFEPIEMRAGRVLHVHPGQVHEYQFEPDFEACVVVYRAGLARARLPGPEWFHGSDAPVLWDVPDAGLEEIIAAVAEIHREQDRFDGSVASVMLLESLLAVLLARVHQHVGDAADTSALPEAYVRYRAFVEEHFRDRPTVTACAGELGYSTRTLDRACRAAVGRSAKAVLDERVALDVRRLLTNTEATISRIGSAFGFTDPSSFSKFVTRHLGAAPTQIRARAVARAAP